MRKMLKIGIYVGMKVMPEKIMVCQTWYVGQDNRKRI
jgi:hypothetical protein